MDLGGPRRRNGPAPRAGVGARRRRLPGRLRPRQPAGPQPRGQPPAGQVVDAGERVGGLQRAAHGHDQHAGAEPHAARDSGGVRQHADRVALLTAGPVNAITSILGPLPRLLILIGNAITPGRGFREGPFSTETELREMTLAPTSRTSLYMNDMLPNAEFSTRLDASMPVYAERARKASAEAIEQAGAGTSATAGARRATR